MNDDSFSVGVFSYLAVEQGHPTVYYRDAAGNNVEVCSVFRSVEEANTMYKWEDMKIVSTTLVKYVSAGRQRDEFMFRK